MSARSTSPRLNRGASPCKISPGPVGRNPSARSLTQGFTHVDPIGSWLRLADLTVERRREFMAVLSDLGLTTVSLSTARPSAIDPDHVDENLVYSHRVIDTAAELGVETVSFGLMRALTEDQKRELRFWTVQRPVDPQDELV